MSPRILLHTIAIEPLRWRPERVFRPLPELLPAIALAGFSELELFAPHAEPMGTGALAGLLSAHGLGAPVLSSYAAGPEFPALAASVREGGFEKVRLFPGSGQSPDDPAACERLVLDVRALADAVPETTVLLETHDNSIADSPIRIVEIVERIARPNVGLVWQPTRFEPDLARRQFAIQRPWIRHYHLQNRTAANAFTGVFDGVVDWEEILATHPADASVEFVAAGMAPPESFDLTAALRECAAVAERVRDIR